MAKQEGTAPAVEVDDQIPEDEPNALDADALKMIAKGAALEALEEYQPKLVDALSSEVAIVTKEQVLDDATIDRFGAKSNASVLAGASVVADRVMDRVDEKYAQEMQRQKWTWWQKALTAVGTITGVAIVYGLGKRSGAKIARLEKG